MLNDNFLFPSPESSKPNQDRFYHKRAVELHKALAKKRKIFRKVNINKWKMEFKNLSVKDGVEKSHIKEVLNWYIKHIGEEYMFKAYSASAFREKFDSIAAAMEERQDPERENKPNYSPGDPEDDFEMTTEEWTDAQGKRHGRDSIDYGKSEQDDEDED